MRKSGFFCSVSRPMNRQVNTAGLEGFREMYGCRSMPLAMATALDFWYQVGRVPGKIVSVFLRNLVRKRIAAWSGRRSYIL